MVIMTNEILKKKHERSVGDQLVKWINATFSKKYIIKDGPVIPDLTYCDNGHEISIEVTGAYYDKQSATISWQSARNNRTNKNIWQGINFNKDLIANINEILRKKSQKQYGPNCLLAIYVNAPITTFGKFNDLIKDIVIPPNPFEGIFILFDNYIIKLEADIC